LDNFIRHRGNGAIFYEEVDSFEGANLPSSILDSGPGSESIGGGGQIGHMTEMVGERDKRASRMWIDYINDQNKV